MSDLCYKIRHTLVCPIKVTRHLLILFIFSPALQPYLEFWIYIFTFASSLEEILFHLVILTLHLLNFK